MHLSGIRQVILGARQCFIVLRQHQTFSSLAGNPAKNASTNGYSIIGSAFGHGAQIPGTAKAPHYLQYEFKLMDKLQQRGHQGWTWKETVALVPNVMDAVGELGRNFYAVLKHNTVLANSVHRTMQDNFFPIILGGDHSGGIGTWCGVVDALDAAEKFGLIWIDAHMDAHTVLTSPSKAYHGMPLAILLGEDKGELGRLRGYPGRAIDPDHLVLMGIRSYEEGEEKILSRNGATIYHMSHVKRRGIKRLFENALEVVTSETKGFGISIDLDVFDPKQVPGVGSPEEDGLDFQETKGLLSILFSHPKLKALEIVELNPERDVNDQSANALLEILDIFGQTQGKKQVNVN